MCKNVELEVCVEQSFTQTKQPMKYTMYTNEIQMVTQTNNLAL